MTNTNISLVWLLFDPSASLWFLFSSEISPANGNDKLDRVVDSLIKVIYDYRNPGVSTYI